jgi:hypothetical protein
LWRIAPAAQVVGWNLQHHPDDLTRPLDTGNVWDRFIEAADDPNSDGVTQRKLTLSYLALFKKLGYGGPFQNEAKAIAEQVKAANGLDSETEARVREWLLRYLRQLQRSIERARLGEEREDY